jgi:hypothetical protein
MRATTVEDMDQNTPSMRASNNMDSEVTAARPEDDLSVNTG